MDVIRGFEAIIMDLDFRTLLTLGFFMGLITSLVLFMLWIDFRKRYEGILAWLAGNFLFAVGMSLIGMRGMIPFFFTTVLSNILVAGGAFSLLLGTKRFFGIGTPYRTDVAVLGSYVILHLVFSLAVPLFNVRIIMISVLVAWFSGRILLCLFTNKVKTFTNIRIYLIPAFVLYFAISLFRAFSTLVDPVMDDAAFFESSLQVHSVSIFIVLGIFLTMSVVMVVNKRLNDAYLFEYTHAHKTFEASPYVMLITRMSDGLIMKVNDAFTSVFGFSRDETVGKTTTEMGMFSAPDTRQMVISELEADGTVSNLELHLFTKNGSDVIGLYSAASFEVEGETFIVNTFNDITESVKIRDELAFMATHDQLTQLPNRHLLYQKFNAWSATDSQVSVILVDLDCFKIVNDTYGHDFGDEVLVKVSRNLENALLGDDLVGRYGGDEFLFIVPDVKDRDALENRREHYRKALMEPFVIAGLDVTMKGSFGIALNDFKSASVSRLVKLADKGVYAEKENATDCTRLFRSAEVDK